VTFRAKRPVRSPVAEIRSGSKKEVTVANFVKSYLSDESGATAIEYGLIAALIAVVIIGAVTTVGTTLSGVFTNVSGSL